MEGHRINGLPWIADASIARGIDGVCIITLLYC